MNDILLGIGLLVILCVVGVCGFCECCTEMCMDNPNLTEHPNNETPANNIINSSSPIHDDTKSVIEL